MKTKHLLCTLALAGAFTACTQDEFVTEVGSENALAGRKSLGKVTFVAPEGADTRWSVENFNTISPESGDAFSLLLVDVPRTGLDGQHIYAYDNYELVNDIHTNYLFKKNGENWDSEANLVEGNYLFVAPAQNTKGRKAVEITLPTEQNLSLDANGKLDPLSAIKEFAQSGHPFSIGHRFMSDKGPKGEIREAQPKMMSIFAYPEITVANTDDNRDKPAILTKVILKREGSKKFTINAPLNNVAAAKALTNEVFDPQGDDTKDQVVVGDWAGHMNQYFGAWKSIEQEWENESPNTEEIAETEDFEVTLLGKGAQDTYLYNNGLYGATHELLGTPTSTSNYIVINMPGDGIEIPYLGSISFNAIIPAETYSMKTEGEKTQDLVIYAVLANGDVYKKYVTSNSEVTMYPGKRYAAQDYSGLELNPKGSKKFFYTDVHEGSHDGIVVVKENRNVVDIVGGVVTVKTKQQMIDAIQAYAATQNLNIIVEGKNVVYDADVNKAVNVDASQDINIQGHIKVIGGTSAQPLAINQYVTIEDATIESGVVTVANSKSNNGKPTLGKVFVAPKAELTLASSATAGIIYNAGTLTLETVASNVGSVINYAKLNIGDAYNDSQIEISFDACGDGSEVISPSIDPDMMPSVTVLAGGNYTITKNVNYPITVNAKTTDDPAGILTLGDDVEIVKGAVKADNSSKVIPTVGNIINKGVIKGNYELKVSRGLEMTVEGKDAIVESVLRIEEATETPSYVGETIAEADYINAAKVTSSGTLNYVIANGLLVLESGARVEKIDAFCKGEIDNTGKGAIIGTVPGGVTVYAEVSSLDFTTDEKTTATIANLKSYDSPSYHVSIFRLTGKLSLGDGGYTLNAAPINSVAKATIEFVEGSSLEMRDGEFATGSGITIKVSAEDIPWEGISKTRSTFDLTGSNEKGLYWKEDGSNLVATKGNVKFNNCAEVADLK